MKKFYVFLFLAFVAIFLTNCNQIDPVQKSEDGDCMVSLKFGGEITVSESPITKVSSDDLYLIQVYRGGSKFAFGFFDQNSIRLYLKKGTEKYRFVATIIKNGKNLLGDKCRDTTIYAADGVVCTINDGIQRTVSRYNNMDYYYYWDIINSPYYNSIGILLRDGYKGIHSFNQSGAYLKYLHLAIIYGQKYPSCDDWLYGEINDYSPTGEYETLNMDLKRVGFKLKYELSGVTDGEVTVKVYNDQKTFIDNTTSTATYSSEPQFYAFYEARNAWLYADDYMENMTLSVSWLRGIGVTEDYGTKTIQIKRNCLNNIKISLGSNDQSAGMNLTVESENSIGAEGVTIPVQ